RIGGAEAELEPGRERRLDREWMPLDGGTPQAEDPELVRGLDGGKPIAAEEFLMRPGNLELRPVRAQLEQGPDLAEADERIGRRARPAEVERPEHRLAGHQRQDAEPHGEHPEHETPPAGMRVEKPKRLALMGSNG